MTSGWVMRVIRLFSFFSVLRTNAHSICFQKGSSKALSAAGTCWQSKLQWIISLEFDSIKFAFYRAELLLLLDLNRKAIGIVLVPSTSTPAVSSLPRHLFRIDCDTFLASSFGMIECAGGIPGIFGELFTKASSKARFHDSFHETIFNFSIIFWCQWQSFAQHPIESP